MLLFLQSRGSEWWLFHSMRGNTVIRDLESMSMYVPAIVHTRKPWTDPTSVEDAMMKGAFG